MFQNDDRIVRCREALRAIETGADPADAARKAIAIWDEYAPAWLLLATTLLEQDAVAEAEQAAWKALHLSPCQPAYYFQLREAVAQRGEDSTAAWHLMILGMRCCAGGVDVPESVAKEFARRAPSLSEVDFTDPDVYRELADAMAAKPVEGVSTEVPGRLVPFDLLLQLRLQAQEAVEADLLTSIRENAGVCLQLFRAALRQSAFYPRDLNSDSLAVVIAILGELGGPELAEDLLPLCALADEQTFAHANWAMWRMGQRLPVETLAAIAAATPTASVALRCAFAEHLGLLPKGIDAEAVLRGLLESLGTNDEAAVLLLAVSDALARRGHRGASRTVYREHLPALDAEPRRWIEKAVREGSFEPKLIEDDLVGHTLQEVCLDRLLMEEEDGEDDQEEDDEPEEQRPPEARPGRNDPCWCGSGKKYKKCHLAHDDQPSGIRLRERLLIDVLEGVKKWHTRADTDTAHEMYFGPFSGSELPEDQAVGFLHWLVCDFRSRSSGKTPVEEFLRRRGHELTAEGRQLLEAWRDSHFGLFEVLRVEVGKGVEIRDYFGGSPVFVHDVTSSRELVQWDCILSRVETTGGRSEFSADGMMVPRHALPMVEELIEKQRLPDQTPSDFVRATSHRLGREVREMFEDRPAMPKLANTDGDPFEFSTAVYEVRDEAAMLASLRAVKVFDEHEPGRGFAWVGPAGLGPSTSLGRIAIEAGKLKLECNSRKRLERGKKLVEEATGKSIHYLRDEFDTMASAQARMKDEPPKSTRKTIDPELEREVIQKVHAEHYRAWPDIALPALDGLTPREALATESGRRKVHGLIRMFENGASRDRQEGRPAFDFSGLRAQLGLPPD